MYHLSSRQTASKRTWGKQNVIDVMFMAEGLWMLRYEVTSDTDGLDAIMERIKDPKLVPTIGNNSDKKH